MQPDSQRQAQSRTTNSPTDAIGDAPFTEDDHTPHQSRRSRLFRLMQKTSPWRHSPSSDVKEVLLGSNGGTDNDEGLLDMSPLLDLSNLFLRVSVIGAKHLSPKDDDGVLNPYTIVSLNGQRERTHVVKKTADPEWHCTFDFQLFDPMEERSKQGMLWSHGLSLTVCSKDRFKSIYLGQFQLPLEQMFDDTEVIEFDDEKSEVQWFQLQAARQPRRFVLRRRRSPNNEAEDENVGEVGIRLGLVLQGQDHSSEEVLGRIQQAWRMLLDANPYSSPSEGWESTSSLHSDMEHLTVHDMPDNDSRRAVNRKIGLAEPTSSSVTTASSGTATPPKTKRRYRKRFRRRGKDQIAQFLPDIVGVTFLEIAHANDLPPEKNVTRTGFDMDPFVVCSYGASTFRTRAIRHNLNPVWNEKLFFHVRQNESNYKLKFAVYDKDKFSNNDFVAWQEIPITDIINNPQVNTTCAMKASIPAEAIEAGMDLHTIPLQMAKQEKWQDRHPTLTFRAKFVPYSEIRKMFWMALAKTYDSDESGSMNRLEIQSMLESVGSTISEATLDAFWRRHGKDPANETDELSIDEMVQCLEEFMLTHDGHLGSATKATENLVHNTGEETPSDDEEEGAYTDDSSYPQSEDAEDVDDADDDEALIDAQGVQFTGAASSNLSEILVDAEDEGRGDSANEKVIRLAECPICHRPNLASRAQMDIVTHVATCAANDWTTVDRFLMGNFVTEAYAQRRWFVKLVSKVGYGKYSVGTNNANIIVQDRASGQLIEERMSVYVRLGMRLIYKGMKTGIQSKTAQRILTNMTIKQGRRFDAPESVHEIQPFIKFHQLDLSEVLHPVSEFKSFNEFFYRELKPGARPCDSPDDPNVAVSAADCRMMAFQTIDIATNIWIKGIEFSLAKLLGDDEKAKDFEGGSLAIFRLAPQDYHRFHSPVDGVITEIKQIAGQYYTVNPMAIRTTLDVYGENARSVVHMDTDVFGKVAVACIGAMMVGSTVLTAKEGMRLARADELGYFAFGGSTLVVLWQKDKIKFDSDLLENAEKPLETLVRVGNHIGRRC
ncbi:hypothetical protein EC973_004133 [Apophysomyces ossiformis]|uniref:Phosphatidylserine decarboxylase proenzyme 2 n=1 Tax=Apophysomyces ossiformis TaxID=679940 RepID=A0A8H7BGB0_9FUNG|nr:hypothetical protein EC973_004133 [Apophysomyces ossiformis]